ncbi:MAG TPA: hypothetical protein VEU08_18770, partial [Vicinamibacterales bacterium]|nr:hypothetical protein [Vicinamibacterales bacterium]
MASEARTLAKAAGAAQRLAGPASALARLAEDLSLPIQIQANAVVEELDLLRFYLREALLAGVIAAQAAPPPLAVPAHVEAMLDGSAPPPDPAPFCPALRPAQSTPTPKKSNRRRSGESKR